MPPNSPFPPSPALLGLREHLCMKGAHAGVHPSVRAHQRERMNAFLSSVGVSIWVKHLGSCQGLGKVGSWPTQLAHNQKHRRVRAHTHTQAHKRRQRKAKSHQVISALPPHQSQHPATAPESRFCSTKAEKSKRGRNI